MAELHASPGFAFACKHILSEAERCSIKKVEVTFTSPSQDVGLKGSATENMQLLDPSPLHDNVGAEDNARNGDWWEGESKGPIGLVSQRQTRRSFAQSFKRRRSSD